MIWFPWQDNKAMVRREKLCSGQWLRQIIFFFLLSNLFAFEKEAGELFSSRSAFLTKKYKVVLPRKSSRKNKPERKKEFWTVGPPEKSLSYYSYRITDTRSTSPFFVRTNCPIKPFLASKINITRVLLIVPLSAKVIEEEGRKNRSPPKKGKYLWKLAKD